MENCSNSISLNYMSSHIEYTPNGINMLQNVQNHSMYAKENNETEGTANVIGQTFYTYYSNPCQEVFTRNFELLKIKYRKQMTPNLDFDLLEAIYKEEDSSLFFEKMFLYFTSL